VRVELRLPELVRSQMQYFQQMPEIEHYFSHYEKQMFIM
jgi:hypothetical protein